VKLWVFKKKFEKHQGKISSEKNALPKKKKTKTKQELGGKKALAQRANNQENQKAKTKRIV